MTSSRALAGSVAVLLLAAVAEAGCSSSKSRKATKSAPPAAEGDAALTFAEVIEPIVQDKCQGCHRGGGIAPFSLVTYEEVKAMGEAAKIKVASREMPPWGAFDDEACTMSHGIKDDLRLSEAQVDDFVRWVDSGMPLGDESKRPPLRTSFAASGLASKTATYALAEPHTVQPGKDEIRCFPIDPGFTADAWIRGSNVVPGDPRVVHHVIVYVDPERQSAEKVEADGGYSCFGGPDLGGIPSMLLAWAPGVPPTTYGEGTALKIPQGAHLVMQVHYHPGQETVSDRTTIEVEQIDAKPAYVAQVIILGNATSEKGLLRLLPGPNDPPSGPEFFIPSNVKGHTETMEVTIPPGLGIGPLALHGVGAHMHWAGVDMKIELDRAKASGGQPAKECLLGAPRYDFNWQRGYSYDEPYENLPRVDVGDTLRLTCTYDNTKENRYIAREMSERRMSAPPDIRLGETTVDEMCLGVFVAVRPATASD